MHISIEAQELLIFPLLVILFPQSSEKISQDHFCIIAVYLDLR